MARLLNLPSKLLGHAFESKWVRRFSGTGINAALGSLLAALAFAELLYRGLMATNPDDDFAYIFAAGRLWAAHEDPYGEKFKQLIHSLFYVHGSWPANWWTPPEYWANPFNWSVLAIPVGALSFPTAVLVWNMALIGSMSVPLCFCGHAPTNS